MKLSFWLKHPNLIAARTQYWMWERMNADKPWLCPGTIHYCEQNLSKSMKALEFGSGRSTVWFANHVGAIASIEHNSAWYSRVQADLERQEIRNVDYHLIPLDHPESEPEQANYPVCPAYVKVLDRFADETLDLIVVDGHYRTTCIKHSLKKLKPGGLLLVDDINLWPSLEALPIPNNWQRVDESTNGIKKTYIWQKPVSAG